MWTENLFSFMGSFFRQEDNADDALIRDLRLETEIYAKQQALHM
ncbi:hypothetical protein MKY27_09055 [Solibacillus sp. FSL R5-0449]